jgi:hypothetical protein
MAQMSLLQIIQAAQGELGLPVASAVVGNTDLTTTQMLAMANNEVDELRQEHNWTSLMFEYNLVVPPPITIVGNITNSANLAQVTGITPSTTGILANYMQVAGNSIPQAARVLSVDSSSQITMNMAATGTGTGLTLLCAQDTFPEPIGFDHMQNRTWWDRTNRWELLGPDSPQMDQWHRSGIVATGPRRHFRQVGPGITGQGNNYRIWPPPTEITSPLQLVFEYIANTPIVSGGVETGNATATFTRFWSADTDISLLDDRAIIMGIKWRYWEQKGFNYLPKQQMYVDYVSRLKARDGAAPTLNIVKRVHPIFISPANVQDGFYPGPVGPNLG